MTIQNRLVGTTAWVAGGIAVGLLVLTVGCGHRGGGAGKAVIRNKGSDTMINVAQAWAERYSKKQPEASVQVGGGGSGVGITALIQGTCDMANTSRKMTPEELERVKAKHNADAVEHVVGFDALGVYVHKDNPLDSISLEELAEVYGTNGTITKWSQLGVTPKGGVDEITRVGRQNSSGTYECFREVVLGKKRDYKLGSIDQSGSKDVVALIASTPSAIGYSGMGYATPEVKMLKIAKHKGEPGIAPTTETAKAGTYPITRPLQIYTVGEPAGAIKDYLEWIVGPEGQATVRDLGYVPKYEH